MLSLVFGKFYLCVTCIYLQVGHGPLQSVNHSSSVQMINLLKRITKLNKQLMEVRSSNECLVMPKITITIIAGRLN